MTNSNLLQTQFLNHDFDDRLKDIYGNDEEILTYQLERYNNAIQQYNDLFGTDDVEIYSAPGRTEVCGNHTDHQNGMVLAASINLDAIAIVGKNNHNTIEIKSEGYPLLQFDCNHLDMIESEKETTTALVKGVLSKMKNEGYQIGPFKAYITSDVFSGSGLSSSAAFESLIGTIISGLFNNMSISPVEIAMIGQYAENVYFGKPCGLMDQMACSVGDFVHIDFKNPEKPIVNKIEFDIAEKDYSLCIVDTKGSHANLTDDYAAIPTEMKEIADFFNKEHLSEITKQDFIENLPNIYGKASDRSILRAFHFFNENERVAKAAQMLSEDNFEAFLSIIKESGTSSYQFLQNVYSNKYEQTQPVPITLAMSEYFLGNHGVCRVHGGGFAGTIQAFVKTDFVPEYKKQIEKILGFGTCHVLKIRKYGGIKVL